MGMLIALIVLSSLSSGLVALVSAIGGGPAMTVFSASMVGSVVTFALASFFAQFADS